MRKLHSASNMPWRSFLCCVIVACSAHPAAAEDKFEWSATISGTSDYVFRGFSLTNDGPAVQASLDASYGNFYVGVFGTNIEDAGYEPVEMDLYTGIRPEWDAASFDLSIVWYTFPGATPQPLGFQYVELKAGVSVSPIKNLKINPVVWYIPSQTHAPETVTLEGSLAYELPAVPIGQPTFSVLLGYSTADDADAFAPGVDSYAYWNAGIELAIKKLTLDFRYWGTSIAGDEAANEFFELAGDSEEGLADDRFVFTVTCTLP
jgi:uncharacterized protein (TIGR02001 family)